MWWRLLADKLFLVKRCCNAHTKCCCTNPKDRVLKFFLPNSSCTFLKLCLDVLSNQTYNKKYSCEQQLSEFKHFKAFKHIRKKV